MEILFIFVFFALVYFIAKLCGFNSSFTEASSNEDKELSERKPWLIPLVIVIAFIIACILV